MEHFDKSFIKKQKALMSSLFFCYYNTVVLSFVLCPTKNKAQKQEMHKQNMFDIIDFLWYYIYRLEK